MMTRFAIHREIRNTQASGVDWRPPTRGVLTVAKGKRTFQPNNRRRARVHGFRLRMRTRAGRAIVSARRGKGRKTLTA
jgi:ribosomal protein L34